MGSRRERRRAQYELLRTLVQRELRGRYRDSLLGVAWAFLQPLTMTAVYYVLFSFLWPNNTIEYYPLYMLTGFIVWNFFSNCLNLGTTAITGSSDIVRKVWFRRELLPLAIVIANGFTSAILFAVVVPIDVIVSGSWATVLLAPVFFGLLMLLCFGLASILATVNVFFRDISHIVNVLLFPLFFMTPVLYDLDQFPRQPPEWFIAILRYGNPVTPYMEAIRATVLEHSLPSLPIALYCLIAAPLVAALGIWVLRRRDDRIAINL